MIRAIFSVILLAFGLLIPARAIDTNGSPDTTQPTDTDVAGWTSGWGTQNDADNITGWNYVGEVREGQDNFASGVYLGNGWVLTAGHVGPGDFTLGGTTYSYISGSAQSITNGGNTADLTLFRISAPPSLSSLTLSQTDPVPFSQSQTGSSVVMLGYGDSSPNESWGYNTVTQINQSITPDGYAYVSNDFLTVTGTYTDGTASITNDATVVLHDSGGGDFIYNSTTGLWELAGINEVTGSGTFNGQNVNFSGFVQLDTYASTIDSIIAAPEPSTWALFGIGLAMVVIYSRRRSIGR